MEWKCDIAVLWAMADILVTGKASLSAFVLCEGPANRNHVKNVRNLEPEIKQQENNNTKTFIINHVRCPKKASPLNN